MAGDMATDMVTDMVTDMATDMATGMATGITAEQERDDGPAYAWPFSPSQLGARVWGISIRSSTRPTVWSTSSAMLPGFW